MPNPSNYYEPRHQLHPKAGKNEDNGSIPPRLAHDYRLLYHARQHMDYEGEPETHQKSLAEQVAKTAKGRVMQIFAEKYSNEPEYIMDEKDLDEEDFLNKEYFSEEFKREINEDIEDEAISEAEKGEDNGELISIQEEHSKATMKEKLRKKAEKYDKKIIRGQNYSYLTGDRQPTKKAVSKRRKHEEDIRQSKRAA